MVIRFLFLKGKLENSITHEMVVVRFWVTKETNEQILKSQSNQIYTGSTEKVRRWGFQGDRLLSITKEKRQVRHEYFSA